jgi:hypothetical protein
VKKGRGKLVRTDGMKTERAEDASIKRSQKSSMRGRDRRAIAQDISPAKQSLSSRKCLEYEYEKHLPRHRGMRAPANT